MCNPSDLSQIPTGVSGHWRVFAFHIKGRIVTSTMSELDFSTFSFDTSEGSADGIYAADHALEQDVFTKLAECLGYIEDPSIKVSREALITSSADYVDATQLVATFEASCSAVASQHEWLDDRLTVRRGLRISEVAVYYHVGDFSACVSQLHAVIDDVRASAMIELPGEMPIGDRIYLGELYKILHHVQARSVGKHALKSA